MRDYIVIVDRGQPQPVKAASSFDAWKAAIEANPEAGRVEVKAPSHSLTLDRRPATPLRPSLVCCQGCNLPLPRGECDCLAEDASCGN